MIFLLIVSGLLNLVALYVIWNLLRKTEILEDNLQEYETFFQNLDTAAKTIINQLERIDSRGYFESDDDVGILFKGIRGIILQLGQFFQTKGGADAENKESN